MVKTLKTTKSDLIRKAVIYYKDALEKEKLKAQMKQASLKVRNESLKYPKNLKIVWMMKYNV